MQFYENTEKTLYKIERNVVEIAAKMKLGYKLNPDNIFFDSQEFMLLMNISKRTAQQWRDNNTIGYSQVGNKIYYTSYGIRTIHN